MYRRKFIELLFSLVEIVVPVPSRYVNPLRLTTICSCVPTTGSSEKGRRVDDPDAVDCQVRRPTAIHLLHDSHKFTIILPSCPHYPRGVSVFPLSSLLQNSKSYVTYEEIRADLHSRKGVWRFPGATLQIPRLDRTGQDGTSKIIQTGTNQLCCRDLGRGPSCDAPG
jgi:hypothetical protein